MLYISKSRKLLFSDLIHNSLLNFIDGKSKEIGEGWGEIIQMDGTVTRTSSFRNASSALTSFGCSLAAAVACGLCALPVWLGVELGVSSRERGGVAWAGSCLARACEGCAGLS